MCRSQAPACFVIELVCLLQQAGGLLGSSSPLVRLYPGRLSDTGCHEVGWAQDKLLFLHQQRTNKEPTDVCAHIQSTFSNAGQEVMEDLLLVLAEKFNYALTKDVLT